MKNVVLCCDGTANEFARDRTNVVKLFYALEHDTSRQVAYYHPGLGTMEPTGALTGFGKAITKLLGKAIGYGLEADVRDAYVFLMNNFSPDDRVYLFGGAPSNCYRRASCLLPPKSVAITGADPTSSRARARWA